MRRTLAKLHLWTGLILGVFWTIQGLSGAAMVFHRQLDTTNGAILTTAPMAPPSRLIASAERETGLTIQRLTAIGPDLRILEARYNDPAGKPQALRLDAATGRVLARREREPTTPFTGSSWRWLYLVHVSVMAGPVGRIFIGLTGLFLTFTVAAGLYLAWPRPGKWRVAFDVTRWRKASQILYGWHRAIGLSTGVLLILAGVTGTYQVFGADLAPALARVLPFQPIAAMSHHMGAAESHHTHAAIGPDEALSIAQARFPDAKFMNLELPAEHPEYYSVRFTLPGEWRVWAGRAMVRIDPASGAVLAVYDPRTAPAFNHIDDAVFAVHSGEAAGIAGQILAVLTGLALPAFFATGLLMWLRKRKPASRSEAQPAPAAARR